MFFNTAYGKEGVKLNFVDRIFVGELTNTIMCEECGHVSRVWRLGQYFNLITMSPWVKRAPRILKVCCLLTGRSSIEDIVTLNKHIVKLVSSLFVHHINYKNYSVFADCLVIQAFLVHLICPLCICDFKFF